MVEQASGLGSTVLPPGWVKRPWSANLALKKVQKRSPLPAWLGGGACWVIRMEAKLVLNNREDLWKE